MEVKSNVIADGREAILIFVDTIWTRPDGTPADLLCRVKFRDGENSATNGWYHMSELKLSETPFTPDYKDMEKPKISFSRFQEIEKSLEISFGEIVSVERMPKSDKMLKLGVNFGGEIKTVMTNIGNQVDPAILQGKMMPFVTNLEPAKIMNVESQAMILVPYGVDMQVFPDLNPQPGARLI